MSITIKRRAVVLVGAGASVEYGIPTTIGFGALIDDVVRNDSVCQDFGGTKVYFKVQRRLIKHYNGDAGDAHFERLFHVLHELSAMHLIPGAFPEFRPVMQPFLKFSKLYENKAVRVAAQTMLRAIYAKTSQACDSPKTSLDPLRTFLSSLSDRFLPRIYSTNYDDFFQQGGADSYVNGFTNPIGDCHLFDPASYWATWDQPGCFHIHGSVRMGFPLPRTGAADIGDIGWFPSRKDAGKHSDFSGSSISRMDGTSIMRSQITTGLDKLGRLQQIPFATYYAGLARDVMEADVIFVIGSGLADLHLNTWLKAVRRYKPHVPLLYVGYWKGSAAEFCSEMQYENSAFGIALYHDLLVDLMSIRESSFKATDGWTIDANRRAAVWADGFQAFLANPRALTTVLSELRVL